MRVTESYLRGAALSGIRRGYTAMAAASKAISSGRRVAAPSDDPTTADAVRRVDAATLSTADRLARAGIATGRLTASESALGQSSETLLRAQELAVQMSNDVYSPEQRASAAAEVRAIRDSLLSTANTRFEGAYVFGGRKEDTPPFDDAGAFIGDTGSREVGVAEGLDVAVTTTGEAFNGGTSGVDVFAQLDALATAMDNDDGDAVAASIETLETARSQITAARAEVGTRLSALSSAEALGEQMKEHLAMRRRDLVDTDLAEAATELTRTQQVLNAAVSVSQRLLDPSTLNRLMT